MGMYLNVLELFSKHLALSKVGHIILNQPHVQHGQNIERPRSFLLTLLNKVNDTLISCP